MLISGIRIRIIHFWMQVLFVLLVLLLLAFSSSFSTFPMLRKSSLISRGLDTNASRFLRSVSSRALPTEILTNSEADRAARCRAFLDASPDPYHCVQTVTRSLQQAGFQELSESSLWASEKLIRPGGKYYFNRLGTSLVAFAVGPRYSAGNGVKVLGAHTDSPNLRLKPNSQRSSSGMIQLNVEPYGGGLWHSWFDRDLSLSGQVIVRQANGTLQRQLIRIPHPILRIPNLCIHLRTVEEREAFKVNKEEHLAPLLCAEVNQTLSADSWASGQPPQLLHLLAESLQCNVEDIADFDLSLFDVQPAARSGLGGEFLVSSRLDNLASCFVLQETLIDYCTSDKFAADSEISMMALFDHEEVGSESATGAGSTLIADTIQRILDATGKGDNTNEMVMVSKAKSMIMSVDMAHAVHPNYANKHEKQHAPVMNGGIVIKTNSNQRYATNSVTGFLAREIARRQELPVQEFAVRNDCPCGSTIGPT